MKWNGTKAPFLFCLLLLLFFSLMPSCVMILLHHWFTTQSKVVNTLKTFACYKAVLINCLSNQKSIFYNPYQQRDTELFFFSNYDFYNTNYDFCNTKQTLNYDFYNTTNDFNFAKSFLFSIFAKYDTFNTSAKPWNHE